MSTLSEKQFPARLFHGSVSELRGTHLVPGQFGGASGGQDEWKHEGQSRHDYVSASEHEHMAWDFASRAAGQRMAKGRTRVYEVEPNSETKMGIEHADHPVLQKAFAENAWKKPQPAGEWVSPQFKVVAQHDTRPGAQGTFPTIDWNEHKAKGSMVDANHEHVAAPQYERHYNEAWRQHWRDRGAARAAARENPSANGQQKETLF